MLARVVHCSVVSMCLRHRQRQPPLSVWVWVCVWKWPFTCSAKPCREKQRWATTHPSSLRSKHQKPSIHQLALTLQSTLHFSCALLVHCSGPFAARSHSAASLKVLWLCLGLREPHVEMFRLIVVPVDLALIQNIFFLCGCRLALGMCFAACLGTLPTCWCPLVR